MSIKLRLTAASAAEQTLTNPRLMAELLPRARPFGPNGGKQANKRQKLEKIKIPAKTKPPKKRMVLGQQRMGTKGLPTIRVW